MLEITLLSITKTDISRAHALRYFAIFIWRLKKVASATRACHLWPSCVNFAWQPPLLLIVLPVSLNYYLFWPLFSQENSNIQTHQHGFHIPCFCTSLKVLPTQHLLVWSPADMKQIVTLYLSTTFDFASSSCACHCILNYLCFPLPTGRTSCKTTTGEVGHCEGGPKYRESGSTPWGRNNSSFINKNRKRWWGGHVLISTVKSAKYMLHWRKTYTRCPVHYYCSFSMLFHVQCLSNFFFGNRNTLICRADI